MKNVKKMVQSFAVLSIFTIGFMACEKKEIAVNPKDALSQTENRVPIISPPPVPYGPNLLVTRITSNLPTISPTACGGTGLQTTCGVLYTLTVEVTNIGNAPVTNHYDLELDKTTGNLVTNTFTSPTPTLAVGATHTFIIGPAPFGGCSGVPYTTQDLVLTADIFNTVIETDETDNAARPYRYCGD